MSTAVRAPWDHEARRRAASDFSVNLVVSAGAGTGKTTLLVERVLTAIASGRAPLSAMAAISFTEKAAGELRHRLAEGLAELRGLAAGSVPGARPAACSAFTRLLEAGEDPEAILVRAVQAEQQLDRATVTTIHGLCSEILRAHPLESGLAPGFEVDRGLAGRRMAAEDWAAFVEAELGPNGRRVALWGRLLQRFSMAHLAGIARALAGGSISDAAMGDGYRPLDLRAAIGPAALRLSEEICEAVDATPGLTDAPREWLGDAVRALRALAGTGAAAARAVIEGAERLEKPPSVRTKKVSDEAAATLELLIDRTRPLVRGLAQADEAAESDLFEGLLPFARRLRMRQTLSGLADFDGLLVRARDLLRDAPGVRAALKRKYTMVLVDEFQDTDPIQYEIVFFLAEREDRSAPDAYATQLATGSLFIVGDAKQSIYRFRGADYAAYRRAVAHVLAQGGAEIALTSNFRSIAAVLDPVNSLFAGPASTLWRASPFLPDYEPVRSERDGEAGAVVEVWTTGIGGDALAGERRRAEARALAAEIGALAGDGRSWRFDDVLVLFRGFSELAPYLRALREAGVPFVVSGGRTFFERTEIVQAMAVLRAVADPDDPVALLAYRRSPAGGVPDTELAAPEGLPRPALDAADARLAALREAVVSLPVDTAVRHVLEASGLIALSTLSFEAAQRVANLEKLALAASELARHGKHTLIETVEALHEGFEIDEEGDSPLADASVDAVRVMTIHRAKGLEAPVVILADTAAERRGGRGATRFEARMTRTDGAEHVSLKGPGFKNAAAIAASLDDLRHEEAEDVRLLYVALTRARDRLCVFGAGGRRGSPWSEAVSSWTAGVVHKTVVAPARAAPLAPSRVPGAPEAVLRYEAAIDAIRRSPDPPFRSPSHLGERGAVTSPAARGADALFPREVGRMVHERLAGWAATGDGPPLAEAERILREFAGTPAAARLAALDVVGREVPMLLAKDGVRWRGSIDLLYRDADGGLVIADFKTDASDEGAVLKHRGQLGIYAEALRRAVPGARVRAELWMLRSGRVLTVD